MEEDIHICGRCRNEFRDIRLFLNHKKECEKLKPQCSINDAKMIQCQSNVSFAKPLLACFPCEEDNVFLVSKSSFYKQGVNNGDTANLESRQNTTGNFESVTSHNKLSDLSVQIHSDDKGDTLNQYFSPLPCTSTNSTKFLKALNYVVTSDNLPTNKESIPQSLIKSEHLYPLQVNRMEIETSLVNDNSNALDSLTADLLLSKQKEDHYENKINETEIEVHFVGKGCTTQNFEEVSLNSLDSSHFHIATKDNEKDIHFNNTLNNIESGQMQHNANVNSHGQQDIESYSDSSTPCPEDLEVGEISAAIAGQENQHSCLKSLLGMNKRLEKNKPNVMIENLQCDSNISYVHCDNNEEGILKANPSYSTYIRKNTASAPITKNKGRSVGKSSVKKSQEKRERLQGVSDDLLISPLPSISGEASFTSLSIDEALAPVEGVSSYSFLS